ncbi:hypothetical protein G159_10655 [Planococcus glaciei CHR43]|uniref:hypothetical protein n=1 Tax=Planococcus glaciei TaxID=459472 RepID=UPI0003DF3AFA|nr:hypothetical protein [Planococcus glaciei]ETP68739.1 hypothetical protein G159_10655 [Planococcus glaciei CHR43]
MAFLAIFRKAEATSRGWPPELDNKKSGGGRLAPTSAGGLEEMAFLAIFRKAEATSRGWPPELDNKKSGNGRSALTSTGAGQ